MDRRIAIASAALIVSILGSYQPAQAQTPLQRQLGAATRLECRFAAVTTTDWKSGAASMEVAPVELETSFFDINVEEGTAEADSRFGASFIIARYTSGYMHLMQISDAGPLYITTVMAYDNGNGRFMAVHVRHEYSPIALPGFTSRPEMYVGDCGVPAE
jgi:hypothetical protein